MSKKGMSKREKRLLRDLLEEEELLIDEIAQKKTVQKKKRKKKKEEELITGLLGEAKKDYTEKDQKVVEALLTRMPVKSQNKRESSQQDEDLLRIGRGGDNKHKEALQHALDRYPTVHRMRIIRFLVLLILALLVFLFFAMRTGFLDIDEVPKMKNTAVGDGVRTIFINKTIYENRTHIIIENISLQPFIDDINNYDDIETSMVGYLVHRTERKKDLVFHKYYIVDDYGEGLLLTRVDDRYLQLFGDGRSTDKVYNVTGTLRYITGRLEFKVTTITTAEKPATIKREIIERTITVEETVPVEKPAEGFLSNFM